MLSILRKLFLLSVTLFSVAASFNASAESTIKGQKDTVVVGVITQHNTENSMLDSTGPFYDINLDYLTNISKALNLKLELRPYKHIPPLLADVESGVIDGAVGLSETSCFSSACRAVICDRT